MIDAHAHMKRIHFSVSSLIIASRYFIVVFIFLSPLTLPSPFSLILARNESRSEHQLWPMIEQVEREGGKGG